MKKKIEAELKKLAQDILNGDVEKHADQLKQEAKVLYEKLTILQFTFSNLEEVQPETKTDFKEENAPLATVSYANDIEAPSKPEPSRTKTQTTNKEGNYFVPDGTEFNENDAITEPATEKIKDIVAQMPPETEGLDRLMQALNEDWSKVKPELEEPQSNWPSSKKSSETDGAKETEIQKAPETPTVQETKAEDHKEPEATNDPEIPKEYFSRPPLFESKDVEREPSKQKEEQKSEDSGTSEKAEENSTDFSQIGVDYDKLPDFEPLNHKQNLNRPKSVNDRLKSSISIGLNDRLAYIKHLFNGDTADYNRVLSQLNTFSDFTEAYKFIEMVVKPDYNNWEGKEQYEDRFVQVIANKFQQ